jgi:hypothetical protein
MFYQRSWPLTTGYQVACFRITVQAIGITRVGQFVG